MHLRNCYGFWLICYDALAHSLRTAEMLLVLGRFVTRPGRFVAFTQMTCASGLSGPKSLGGQSMMW